MSESTAVLGRELDPTRSELGARVRSGLAWKLFSEGLRFVCRTGVAVVLARTLGPHDFGVAAMALILSSFVVSFADLGLGGAIVQARTLSQTGISTVFWASIAAGAVFTAAGVAAAGQVAAFFGEPRVGPLVMVLSLSFVITSLGSTHRSLLVRAMDFRSLELRFLAAVVVSAAAGLAAALGGLGPWALIVQEVVLAAVSTALVWLIVPWRPALRFSWSELRGLGGYGFRSVGGFLFSSLNQNADNLLVGRVLGPAALGIYSLAYSAILMPLTRVVTPIQQVLFPAFSRLQHDRPAMAAAWLRTLRTIAALVTPMMLGLIVCAPELVPAVFGSKWAPAVRVVQVLAAASIVQCVVTMNGTALLALGAARRYMHISAVTFLVNLAAFAVGLMWGVLGVATAFAVSSTVVAVCYTAVTAHALQTTLLDVGRVLRGVAQAGLGMVVIVATVRLALSHQGAATQLSACIALGVVTYLALLSWFDAELVAEVKVALRRRRAPRAEALRSPA